MEMISILLLLDTLMLAVSYQLASINDAAAWSMIGFTGLAILWQLAIFSCTPSPTRMLRVAVEIRLPHVIQGLVQLCIYVYWGLYWDQPAKYAIFIVGQIGCAYMLDMLLSLSRHQEWRAGFGPVPIMLSINLFIWFKPEYFYMQLSMVTVTYLAKEFLTWQRDGKTRHIFNPSGFSLTVAAVLLLCSRTAGTYTTGVNLVESFELMPSFYEVIFILGLVVQILFATTPVTIGAVLFHFVLFFIVSWMLGGRAAAFPIDRSIFLAMTLLVPDPATSPKSAWGRLLFGATYGTAVFLTALGLKYTHQPDYFSKILVIPLLNLMTPWFDRLAHMKINPGQLLAKLGRPLLVTPWRLKTGSVVLYVCLFLSIIGSLKSPRTTPLGRPWLLPVADGDTRQMEDQIFKMLYSRQTYPEVFKPFRFGREIALYPKISAIYDGPWPPLSIERKAAGPDRIDGP